MIRKLFWMWICVTAGELIALGLTIWNTGFDWKFYWNCAGLLICIYGWNTWFQMRKAEQDRIAAMIDELGNFTKEMVRRIEEGEIVIHPSMGAMFSNPSDKDQNQ